MGLILSMGLRVEKFEKKWKMELFILKGIYLYVFVREYERGWYMFGEKIEEKLEK